MKLRQNQTSHSLKLFEIFCFCGLHLFDEVRSNICSPVGGFLQTCIKEVTFPDRLYPCWHCWGPRPSSFCWKAPSDGRMGNLLQRTQRPERSGGQWALISFYLASVTSNGYQSTVCFQRPGVCELKCVFDEASRCRTTEKFSTKTKLQVKKPRSFFYHSFLFDPILPDEAAAVGLPWLRAQKE